MYAQIINGIVNLIGGKEVGLPLPESFLIENPDVLCINITKTKPKPQAGDFYMDGKFYTPEEFGAKFADIVPPDEV